MGLKTYTVHVYITVNTVFNVTRNLKRKKKSFYIQMRYKSYQNRIVSFFLKHLSIPAAILWYMF